MRTNIFFLVFLVLLSGCSTTYPAYKSYALVIENKEESKQFCTQKTLRIMDVQTDRNLMQKKMFYIRGLESYAYSESKWAQRPSELITDAIVKGIQKSHIYKTILNADSKAKSRYILESRVDDFMQYYDKDAKKSYVHVSIVFFLIDTESADVIESFSFDAKKTCLSADAQGGVQALNALLNDTVIFLRKKLQRREC